MSYHEEKKHLIRSLITKAKNEIKALEAEVAQLERVGVGLVKQAIIQFAEKSDKKLKEDISHIKKKRKYTKRSKYWKKHT